MARIEGLAELVVGVDVGTRSARAGVFARDGRMLARAERDIALNEPGGARAEQDSEDIWRAVCAAVRAARDEAGARAEDISGLGFDATCSLVLRDGAGRPLGLSEGGADRWDTILWMDHRAQAEAAACTATGDAVLERLGGVMSPEMQIPKLMWIKRHLPERWARLGFAFDLADFLTWKATGSAERSICTLASKWAHMADAPPAWRVDFLASVDLSDLRARAGLPGAGRAVGADLGPLRAEAAVELGLGPWVRVGAGMIDAHAGALGVLGGLDPEARERSAALIAGTSNCLMTLSAAPVAGAGLWGPFRDVALPGLWMTEGGQSASGALLDHVCRFGGDTPSPALHARIWTRIDALRAEEGWDLAGGLHVLPDFRGNRSPDAEPSARGAISGLALDASFDGLCRLYWRSAVGIAVGLRAVLEAMRAAGCRIETVRATGGHVRNAGLTQLYAAALGAPLVVLDAQDAVLSGAAMTAASAAGLHSDLGAAARAMQAPGRLVEVDPDGVRRLEGDGRIAAEMRRDRGRIEAASAAIRSDGAGTDAPPEGAAGAGDRDAAT